MGGHFLLGYGAALWAIGLLLVVALLVIALVALWRGRSRTALTAMLLIGLIFAGLLGVPAFAGVAS